MLDVLSRKMPDQHREQAFAQTLFDRLKIPVSGLESRQRPDLQFSSDGSTVGMEITQSTPSEKYWGGKIAEELGGDLTKPVIYATTQ